MVLVISLFDASSPFLGSSFYPADYDFDILPHFFPQVLIGTPQILPRAPFDFIEVSLGLWVNYVARFG